MPTFLCVTCGTGFPPSDAPPGACPICEDERQYLPPGGQRWTTLEQIRATHQSVFKYDGAFLGIGMTPDFGIGQRALLVRTPRGNILWDCISLVDKASVEIIQALGGLVGIAISHPHYYTSMADWSQAFGGVPVHLHAADREWVMRPSSEIAFWDGERKELLPELTLIRCKGHFDGGTVMHVAGAGDGKGALLAGDILIVAPDRKHVAMMRSYPNYLPLGPAAVRAIAASLDGLAYDAVYGPFWDRIIASDGEASVARSIARHIDWVERDSDAAKVSA